MGLMTDLKEKYNTVSIVGMAKNAGKTTTLNYLIEEAMDEGIVLGVTSTGRDGENTDLVTGTDKPKVYLEEGTIVSVPRILYDLAETGLEILRMTNYRTSMGEVLLCRVAESGYVQIAGPLATAETKKMCREMEELGAEFILIDGAIDRKSIAAPDTSDAIIIATGAVLSRSMNRVVAQTAHIVDLYSLPVFTDERALGEIQERKKDDPILVISRQWVEALDLKTGLSSGRFLDEAIGEDTEYVYLPGAFTKSVIEDITPKKLKNICFILKDPTKVFIDDISWQKWIKKGLKISVLQNIKVAAITVNPFSPGGYAFDHHTLLDAVQEAIPQIPVIDVRL